MDGIFRPIITLKNHYMPYQWAAWSRTHSTVIIGVNQICCEIWDLRRSTLKPISTTEIEQSSNTLAKYEKDSQHSITDPAHIHILNYIYVSVCCIDSHWTAPAWPSATRRVT